MCLQALKIEINLSISVHCLFDWQDRKVEVLFIHECSWITKINYLAVWDEGGLSDHEIQWGFFVIKRF